MTKRILVGSAILIATIVIIVGLVSMKPEPPKKKPFVQAIVVDTKAVEAQDVQFIVDSQGPVLPVENSTLVAEVSGRITDVSDNFRVGAFVEKGEVLFTIDPANYVANVRSAEAALAQAQATYQDAKARTEQARKDWKKIGKGEPSDLVLRLPQLKQAEAAVQSAEADLMRARRDLDRTKVKANFDALIQSKMVGLGQFVNVGSQVATVYGTEYAEVRLPVPDQELAFLDVPDIDNPQQQPAVRLVGTYAGKEQIWFGKLVRTEGVVEQTNRLTYLVAQIADPYNLENKRDNSTPLRFGTFVRAEIAGKEREGLIALPRQALYFGNTVLILENESEVRLQEVTLARTEANTIYIDSGLQSGDEVIVTPVHNPVNGMKVQKVGSQAKTSTANNNDTALNTSADTAKQ
ncbi:efflux RND transporter periplasmic adaptor subunit [Kangiella profundi]|uniref:Efflux RND transporter periplasmic adaptor subunit n=1 Tax=Kangiella profundi TaxID=1561924 RepID=A0A2K9AVB7_9GAMM|nr:efflux RND transporter periplasmic adaptor subunit [Kangiella profundi]AUD79071.1 efflux RND transporter periplasmic adaptor subunit [Kangiella profundi]GGF01727.1 RND superfamily efflux pump MFP component [Kangiella profundi]